GYSSEEFIKNPELLNKLFHPDDTFKLKDHFMELKNPTGEIHEIEYKIITKSGDLKWISHICQPVYNSQGKYLGRRGSNRDITPQKAADEKILKFSRIVENSPAAIILTNKEGIIEYANKHFKNQFKFKNENEFIGKTPKILQSGNTSKEYYENIWNNLNSGKAWNGIIQNKDKEGGLLWLNVSITPITDSEKNIISYAAIYNDITEQLNLLEELKKYKHQLEEMVAKRTKELEKSRETFSALTENSKDVIIRFNRQGKYVYINKAVEQYMNKNVSEIIGKTFYEVGFPLQITELFEKSLNTIFQTKMNCRIEFQLPNGFWFDSLLSPEFDSDGNVTTIISSSRDITEFKKLQLNLQKALDNEKEVNELKDRFISMVSHEFRTPLSSILSSADILEMGGDKLNADRKKTHFIRIKNNIENLTKILDEVVVINKSDLGKFTTSKQNINLETFCSDIFDEFCELYPSIKAEIKFDLNEVHFNLDSAVLRKILSNLLSNAFKYNKTGGSVVFKTEYKDGKIIFEIRDTGMGIPSEEQTNVFEPFFRSSSVQNIKGTGLGLNIVKKLIDQLKG
ncbi:MAG: PAS domain S-box protein, partial [Melioribacteraceae bacterium]